MSNTYFEMKDDFDRELTLTAIMGTKGRILQITVGKPGGTGWVTMRLTKEQIWNLAYQLSRRADGEISATD